MRYLREISNERASSRGDISKGLLIAPRKVKEKNVSFNERNLPVRESREMSEIKPSRIKLGGIDFWRTWFLGRPDGNAATCNEQIKRESRKILFLLLFLFRTRI